MEVYYVKISNVLFCWMSSLIEGSTDDFYRTKGLKSTDFRNFILLVPQKSSVESFINVNIHQKKASKVLIVELEAPFLVCLLTCDLWFWWRRWYPEGEVMKMEIFLSAAASSSKCPPPRLLFFVFTASWHIFLDVVSQSSVGKKLAREVSLSAFISH